MGNNISLRDRAMAMFANNEQVASDYMNLSNYIEALPEHRKNNKELFRFIVQLQGPDKFQFASEKLKDDAEYMILLSWAYPKVIQYASERLRDDKEFMMGMCDRHYNDGMLQYASERLRDDKELVSLSIKKDGRSLKYASKELRNNKNIVLAAVQETASAFEYASPDLRKNKEFILQCLGKTLNPGFMLEYISPELCNDKDIFMTAIKQQAYGLQFASPELKADKELALLAVSRNARALEDISPELRKDKDIILAASKSERDCRLIVYYSGEYIDDEIKNEVYKNIVENEKNIALLKDTNFNIDEKFAIELVAMRPEYADYLPEDLAPKKDLILAAAKYKYLSDMYGEPVSFEKACENAKERAALTNINQEVKQGVIDR